MARALLLTGPVGAGKTTVAIALGELLDERGVRYALVDLDWLCWAAGIDVDAALVANLGAVWQTYRGVGIERLVLTRMLERDEQVDAIRAALDGVELTVVVLTAPDDVLERRIRARDSGAELEQHLALIRRPSRVTAEVTIDADGPPAEIAEALLRFVA